MLHPQVPEWQVKEVDGMKRLERVFKFKSFAQALEFTNKVSVFAEEEDHDSMLITEYGRVAVAWRSGGLHKMISLRPQRQIRCCRCALS